MGLPYSKISEIELEKDVGVGIEPLNTSIQKLIENDLENNPSKRGVVPWIWEKSWLNDPSIPGYSKGSAVWINTEIPENFIFSNRSAILDYVFKNKILFDEYMSFKDEPEKVKNFLLSLVSNFDENRLIFFLGDVKNNSQILVSKIDNNKFLPILPKNKDYWEEFFDYSDHIHDEKEILREYFSKTLNSLFEQHLKDFHPSKDFNLDSNDYVYSNLSNLKEDYLQSFLSDQKKIFGFDFVKLFVKKKYSLDNSEIIPIKWFRLWNSGYLEHGGIINLDQPETSGDSLEYDENEYKVNLTWEYGSNGKLAPAYEYSSSNLFRFYGGYDKIAFPFSDEDPFESPKKYINSENLSPSNRYIISLTPIFKSKENLNSNFNPKNGRFLLNEVNTICGKSFCIVKSPNVSFVSYRCSGMAPNAPYI